MGTSLLALNAFKALKKIVKTFATLFAVLVFVACKNATPVIKGFNDGGSQSNSASGANPVTAPNLMAAAESKTVGSDVYNVQLRSREIGLSQSKTVNGATYQFSGKVVIQ